MSTILSSDLYYGAMIAVAFLGLIVIAEILRSKLSLEVEWTRKLVHLGGGVVCLALPFLIQSHWVVLALSLSMGLIFGVSKKFGYLQSIHAVKRQSYGTEYYPVVVYLLFLLGAHQPWKFVICILALAVSDSVAAIVGSKFGRIKFAIEKECKSLEGAIGFFLATFVIVLIPLVIWDPLGSIEVTSPLLANSDDVVARNNTLHYLLAATLVGLLVMCFELVSLKGRDNLFIPLGTFLVLTKTMQTDVADLVFQNASFLAILAVIISIALGSSSFNVGGAIVICLTSYGCWAMGSFDWAILVFMGFGVYIVSAVTTELPWHIKVRPVVYLALPPMVVMALGNLALNSGRSDLTRFCFGPFLGACCLALAQSVLNVINWKNRRRPRLRQLATLAVSVGGFAFFAGVSALRQGMYDVQTLALILLSVTLVASLSSAMVPAMPPSEAPRRWFYMRMGFSFLAALIIAALQWLGWSDVWNPI